MCMYAYACVYGCVCMCIMCMYVYVCMYVCMCMYVYICMYACIHVCVHISIYVLCVYIHTYVTGYWKTDHNVTLELANYILLAQLIAILMHYSCTVALLG